MNVNYIALAIPFFFLLIGVEALFSAWHKKRYYRLNDSINNLSCGIAEQVLEVFFKGALAAGYVYLYERHALLRIGPESAWAWLALFLGVDLCYYWFHRASHEIAGLWGCHIAHHQSEEFNLSVALRQDAFQKWFSWVFYLPLALLGFPPAMFVTVAAFNTLYQFWIHTRAIGRLGPFEWVLNTPSHHRVHHGADPKYLDKNYGGTLIVWDRLFGSFKAEEEEPRYGITKPLASWNPLWANVHYWVELSRLSRGASTLSEKLLYWLKPPGWSPQNPRPNATAPKGAPPKYDPPAPLGVNLYVLVQFIPAVLGTVLILRGVAEGAPLTELLVLGGLIVLTLLCCGALLELRSWGLKLELLRLPAVAAALLLSAPRAELFSAVFAAVLALALGSGLWLASIRGRFGPVPT
jgi:sterol desaturase/sphingolipid hydroxylase (fatty acid hydroxylase superfamily)